MKANLLFNGHDCSYPEQIANLESLLIFASGELRKNEEVLVDLKVDGEYLVEAYPHETRNMPLSDIDSVEIFSQTAEQLSSRFIRQAPELIEYLKTAFQQAIEMFREGGKDEAAYDMLARCFDSLSSIRNMLSGIQQAGFGSESVVWDDFEGVANRLCSAQVDLDSNAIADLLEEQMLPFLDQWKLAA
jgi:hypothetical protein